jgi:hypothetical protein
VKDRSQEKKKRWVAAFNAAFDQHNGCCRSFKKWTSEAPWKKFMVAVMSALQYYAENHMKRVSLGVCPDAVEILANEMMEERRNEEASISLIRSQRDTMQAAMNAREITMGLLPPRAPEDRGVNAPSLPRRLLNEEVTALSQLCPNPRSPSFAAQGIIPNINFSVLC